MDGWHTWLSRIAKTVDWHRQQVWLWHSTVKVVMAKSFKCSKGWHKYNRKTYEIFEAATKHKDTALVLKEVSEKQKKKIEVYKQKIENLEFEVRDQQKENDAVKWNNSDLKKEIAVFEKTLRTKQKEFDTNEEEFRADNDKLTERVERLWRMNEKHF